MLLSSLKTFTFPVQLSSLTKVSLLVSLVSEAYRALEDTHLVTLSSSAYNQLLEESNEWFKFGKYISDSLLIKKCRKETSFQWIVHLKDINYC